MSEEDKAKAAAVDAHAKAAADAVTEGIREAKKRKASAQKAEEAASADAGTKAGAPSSKVGTSDAPAPNTETAAGSQPPPAVASAAAAPPSPAAAAASPKAMTEAHRTGLRRMHKDIFTLAMGQKKARSIFDDFAKANELGEGDAAYQAGEAILLAHCQRLAGEGSPDLCDAAMNKAVAQ
jgi:hypothetical protein